MSDNSYLHDLNDRAQKFFKRNNFTHAAIAVSGSEESIILLNAAVSAMGAENVLAMTADTGYVRREVIELLHKACLSAGVELCLLPVMLIGTGEADMQNTFDYKRQIFEDMLNECWMIGVDNLCYACTDDNKNLNGNEVIATFDGVYAPFVTEE